MSGKSGKKEIVYAKLKNSIELNEYPTGRLPTEKELAGKFEVAQGTLRQALDLLEKEGLIERIRKRGTFIKNNESDKRRSILCIMHNMDGIENPFIYVQPGMEIEATRNGYRIVPLDYSQVEEMTHNDFNRIFNQGEFAGILLCIHQNMITEKSPWAKSSLPIVVSYSHDYYNFPAAIGRININCREAWRMALEHLLERGHRRIACLTSNKVENLRGMSFDEYKHLLKVNGADPSPQLIAKSSYNKIEIGQAVNKLLDLRQPPTALLCFSDFFAIYACDAAKHRGWVIPDDLAIIGNCGYPGSEFLEVPLSTVSYNYNECGISALKMLLNADQWFGNSKPAPRISIAPTLIERASTNMCREYINSLA